MVQTGSCFITVYGALRSVYFFCGLIVGFLNLALPAIAADYPQQLTEHAGQLSLSGQRTWQVLLHYRPKGEGRESVIDDPRFFLAPTGKTDPGAELAATIRGIFAPAESGDEHPRCRFPARY